jgi:hypothetical protein
LRTQCDRLQQFGIRLSPQLTKIRPCTAWNVQPRFFFLSLRFGHLIETSRQLTEIPMRIKRYRLLVGHSAEELENEVNKFITQGWQPFGSPSIIAPEQKDARYFQAVVLTETEIASKG